MEEVGLKRATHRGDGRRRARAARSGECGTSLLEMLVVMLIVSVLLGIGVGVLGKLSLVNAADNAAAGTRSLVRRIRNYAKNHGTVGTVYLDRKENRIVGLLEKPVGQWHFEGGANGRASEGAFGMAVSFGPGAELVEDGCIGGAVKVDGKNGSGVELGNSSTFASDWGVSLSADVFLDELQAGVILAKGDSYGLAVGSGGELLGWVGVQEGEVGTRLDRVDVSSGQEVVPTGRWVRVGMYYDRVQLRIFIDYRPVGAQQEKRPLGIDDKASLRIGGSPGPISGKVDGVRLGILGPGEGGELAAEVKIKGGTTVIRFNPDGFLDPTYHSQPATIVLEDENGAVKTITVGLMGDVSY